MSRKLSKHYKCHMLANLNDPFLRGRRSGKHRGDSMSVFKYPWFNKLRQDTLPINLKKATTLMNIKT